MSPEAVQISLDPVISFEELSSLSEVLVQSKLGMVIFFQGESEMERCADELRRHFERCCHETRLNHYQQLLFPEVEFFRQFGRYDLSPLVEPFLGAKPGVTIIVNFEQFDEAKMKQVLARIGEVPLGNKWIFLVPLWPATRLSPVFENWATERELPRFQLGFRLGTIGKEHT